MSAKQKCSRELKAILKDILCGALPPLEIPRFVFWLLGGSA